MSANIIYVSNVQRVLRQGIELKRWFYARLALVGLVQDSRRECEAVWGLCGTKRLACLRDCSLLEVP